MGRRSHAPAATTLAAITPGVRSDAGDGHRPAGARAWRGDRLQDGADIAERGGHSVPDRPVRISARLSELDLDWLPAGASERIGKLAALPPDLPRLHDPSVGYEAEVAIEGLAGTNRVHLAIAFQRGFSERLGPDLARTVDESSVDRTKIA